MITVNNKTVKRPYVAVNGDWKKVSTEYAMVNGEWKEVFSGKETYTVNIHRYGSLYQTLSVTEGESVTLPSLGVGFATTSGATTTTYSSGATITPTGNMTLYAVFSYNIRLYKYGSLYTTLTSKSQSSKASFTLPNCSVNSSDDAFYGWTKTSGAADKDYDANQTITSSGTNLYAVFSYTSTSQGTQYHIFDKYNNLDAFPVTIPSYCTVTCTAYNISLNSGVLGETKLSFINSETIFNSTTNAWFTVDGTFRTTSDHTKSTPFTFTADAGTVINAGGHKSQGGNYTFYPYIEISYPVTVTSTLYRSEK